MTISKDLFLAILSMDSYNRGYNAGINFGPGSDGAPIGNATVSRTSGGSAQALAESMGYGDSALN